MRALEMQSRIEDIERKIDELKHGIAGLKESLKEMKRGAKYTKREHDVLLEIEERGKKITLLETEKDFIEENNLLSGEEYVVDLGCFDDMKADRERLLYPQFLPRVHRAIVKSMSGEDWFLKTVMEPYDEFETVSYKKIPEKGKREVLYENLRKFRKMEENPENYDSTEANYDVWAGVIVSRIIRAVRQHFPEE